MKPFLYIPLLFKHFFVIDKVENKLYINSKCVILETLFIACFVCQSYSGGGYKQKSKLLGLFIDLKYYLRENVNHILY